MKIALTQAISLQRPYYTSSVSFVSCIGTYRILSLQNCRCVIVEGEIAPIHLPSCCATCKTLDVVMRKVKGCNCCRNPEMLIGVKRVVYDVSILISKDI